MSFADPQVMTLDGVAKSLVRIRPTGQFGSEYLLSEATQEFRLFIRSQELATEADGRKKYRHNLSLRWTVFGTSTTSELIRQTSVTVEHYKGDDVTKWDDPVLALAAIMTAPNAVKLGNLES